MSISSDAHLVDVEIGTHKGVKLQDSEHADAQYIRLLVKAVEGSAAIKAYIVPHRTDDELRFKLEALRNRASHVPD